MKRLLPLEQVSRPSLLFILTAVMTAVALFSAHQIFHPTTRITGASGARPSAFVAVIPSAGGTLCQTSVTVPRKTGTLEFLAGTYGQAGPKLILTLKPLADKPVLARIIVRRGWHQGFLRVPIDGDPVVDRSLKLCLTSAGGSRIAFAGEREGTPATVNGALAAGKVSVTARSKLKRSMASALPEVSARFGRGNAAWVGPWTLWTIGILVTIGLLLSLYAVATTPTAISASEERGPERSRDGADARIARIPKPARALAVASVAIGSAWALLTPPFQVPDETSHFAYVQYLANTGRLPVEMPGTIPFSVQERKVLDAIGFYRIIGRPNEKVVGSAGDEQRLRSIDRVETFSSEGNAATASANPPLYYLLEAPILIIFSRSGILTQLLMMRFLSVAFLGGSVLMSFIFVREMCPASPLTWTAGGLAAAFLPILGFVSSGVNADSLLFFCCAALFATSARALKRGLTPRRAGAIAVAVAAGLLTKPLFISLLPAAVIVLALAAKQANADRTRSLVWAGVLMLVPVAVVAILGSTEFNHPYFAVATAVASGPASPGANASSLFKEASILIQLFGPRLPFLVDQLPGFPLQDVWVTGLVGVFGWVDYGFSRHTVEAVTWVYCLVLGSAMVTLVRAGMGWRSHWRLAVSCAVGLSCVLLAVGVTDYQAILGGGPRFEQARYLLPLLALYAGLIGLSVKAFGTRLGVVMLSAVWGLVAMHTVAAMVLTLSRYYL